MGAGDSGDITKNTVEEIATALPGIEFARNDPPQSPARRGAPVPKEKLPGGINKSA